MHARADFTPRWLFVGAIATSSFVLFSLELFAGREVLPVFGGAPGVWATALCFFSGILLVGYGYAHLSVTRLGPLRGGLLHVALALLLLAATALAPTTASGLRVYGLPEALNVLLALLVLAGPPALLLAATTPLLSAWFAGSARDAWWLYAASNAASLGGLLAYPFLVEPNLPLSTQRLALLGGLTAFVVLLAAIVALRRRAARAVTPAVGTAAAAGGELDREAIPLRRQAWWLAAAFVPAGLLTATTTFLTTDLVAAPLLWVGPLAIYLASFVVAFSERGRRLLPAVDRLVPAAATLLWLPYVAPVGWPVVPLVVVVLGSFGVLAVALHGRLALSRPSAGHLTHFYLVMSVAGVLATAAVGVVAPVVLPDIYEYPALLIAAPIVLALGSRGAGSLLSGLANLASAGRELVLRLLPYVLIGGLIVAFAGGLDRGVMGLLVVGGLVVVVALNVRMLAIATPVALVAALLVLSAAPGATLLMQGRSFFGVSKVVSEAGGHWLYSGTTLHGVQLTGEPDEPTTYYVREGPLGDVFADLRARISGAAIGVVGLGSGTIAAYSQAGDQLTYFEIDPLVVAVAQDPRYFSYLTEAAVEPRMVEGDGRLSLTASPNGSFDLLVLDAFSSDSVPPHLLTREAIADYMRTLRPGGVLAFNLSNRYYDLASAVGATAASAGLDALEREYEPPSVGTGRSALTGSIWVVVGQSADAGRLAAFGWSPLTAVGPVLTDDYPDITRVLRWRP